MSEQTRGQEQDLRSAALTSLRKKRELATHVVAYVLFNAMLVTIWLLTGADGFFWPIISLFGWGIGLAFHVWDVVSPTPTEEQIRAEMSRLSRR